MGYKIDDIKQIKTTLLDRLNSLQNPIDILKANELKELLGSIKDQPEDQRANFGKAVNDLKVELLKLTTTLEDKEEQNLHPIDITAPFDINTNTENRPHLLNSTKGSVHPLMRELGIVLDIFYRMGFNAEESLELDDDYHMFESLNFPAGHPARDDFDTFMTEEGLIAPAHTSTMQNRVLKKYIKNLSAGQAISVVIPGRVFRNEDLDARHEHTFYQLEGVYVNRGINVGHLIATLKTFLQAYYNQDLEVKTQPFYFPFTEPSFELALSCPFCAKKGCHICSQTGWIELLGCGMIHPNVFKMAGIDPLEYTGFAWGVGIDRLVMMKYSIEDVRHFHTGKLEFLRQF